MKKLLSILDLSFFYLAEDETERIVGLGGEAVLEVNLINTIGQGRTFASNEF